MLLTVEKTHRLVIDIQEGFVNDSLVITVNGAEIFRKNSVTSSPITGPAASCFTSLRSGPVEVSLNIPTRNLADKTSFNITSDIYLGISVVDPEIYGGKVRFILLREPFGYM